MIPLKISFRSMLPVVKNLVWKYDPLEKTSLEVCYRSLKTSFRSMIPLKISFRSMLSVVKNLVGKYATVR